MGDLAFACEAGKKRLGHSDLVFLNLDGIVSKDDHRMKVLTQRSELTSVDGE